MDNYVYLAYIDDFCERFVGYVGTTYESAKRGIREKVDELSQFHFLDNGVLDIDNMPSVLADFIRVLYEPVGKQADAYKWFLVPDKDYTVWTLKYARAGSPDWKNGADAENEIFMSSLGYHFTKQDLLDLYAESNPFEVEIVQEYLDA